MKMKKASKIMALVVAVAMVVVLFPTMMVSAATLNTIGTISGTIDKVAKTVTFIVPYTTDATTGEQITILVTKGSDVITYSDPLTNTQPNNVTYIDQVTTSTTSSFTFVADMPAVGDTTYSVKVGGSGINTPATASKLITVTSDGFTVSGTVSPVAYIDGYPDLNTAMLVTLNLKTSYLGTVVKTITANNQTGEFSFAGVANGSYVMEVKRAGFLSRYFNVTVNGANVTGISKTLMAGDLNDDLAIDASDAGILFEKLGTSYGDGSYIPSIDIFTDYAIDASDDGVLFENLGKDVLIYGEDVNWDN